MPHTKYLEDEGPGRAARSFGVYVSTTVLFGYDSSGSVITQSSGKKRVIIDDATKRGQSAFSSDANKLMLRSP